MFETQKVRDMTSSGKNGLIIRNNFKSQMGQGQVSGGVSVLCWLAAPDAMFYGNLPKFGNKVKIGNKVQFGDRFKNWYNVWSVKGVTVDDYIP